MERSVFRGFLASLMACTAWVGSSFLWGGCLKKDESQSRSQVESKEISGTPGPREDLPLSSEAARRARAHSELLSEMHRVIFQKEPKSRGDFGNWVDTLNQGASLEGVYNGLTHSSDYRELETKNPGATPGALNVFGKEMAFLQKELPEPTRFTREAAKPLPLPVEPRVVTEEERKGANGEGDDVGGGKFMEFKPSGVSEKAPFDVDKLAAEYSSQFVGASIYTLKRVLGDEALKVVAAKAEYREKLALWYSQWVVRMAAYQIDFGLDLRNDPNENFHYRWALQVSDDRIRWEVLNRLHRVLNRANETR